MKKIEIFTDGACSGNPGPGGWGAILRYGGHEKEISGNEHHTTNNRMELTALIKALEILKEPCDITVYSDSQYLCQSISEERAHKWQQNNWINRSKKPVPNSDLWERLLKLLETNKTNFIWIRGHAGHPENERCDRLATAAVKNIKT